MTNNRAAKSATAGATGATESFSGFDIDESISAVKNSNSEKNSGAAPSNTKEPSSNPPTQPQHAGTPASIALLYESRDRKLCLFEDASGHLTSVPTSRLA